MTEDEVFQLVTSLAGVDVLVASESNGSPEVAWGDTFFYYDPGGGREVDRRMPFATIVIQDYPGFDTASRLDRPGVFRVNIGVGRELLAELTGDRESFDYAALDQFIPHPAYAKQGWVSILNPTAANAGRLRELLTAAHARAAGRR